LIQVPVFENELVFDLDDIYILNDYAWRKKLWGQQWI